MANTVLVGRVAQGLETREAGGKNVGSFSIAVDGKEKDGNGKPIPTFYSIETWDAKQQAVLTEQLKTGETVMIKGQLAIETYDRAEGGKGTAVKVASPDVTFLGKANAAKEQIFVAGRLTKDVEVKSVGTSDNRVATLSLAENYGKEKTNFYDIEVWNEQADIMAKHLTKGSMIKADGELKIETYDRADGSKGTRVKIINPNVNFLSSAAGKGGSAAAGAAAAPTAAKKGAASGAAK
ncbi:MAG: single-stranded DNA-binding protein [Firmicutes bacterium]|nr:single-stranded DNA-binding protein [Bacillota bacterium]